MMKFKREGPVRAKCGLKFEVAHIFVTTVYMNFPIKGSKLELNVKMLYFWARNGSYLYSPLAGFS